MNLLIIYLTIPFVIIVVGVIFLWILSLFGIPKDDEDDKIGDDPLGPDRTS